VNSWTRWRINAAIGIACLFLFGGCTSSLETDFLTRAKQASVLPTLSDLNGLSGVMHVKLARSPGSLFFWDVQGGSAFWYPISKVVMSPVGESMARYPGIDPNVPAVSMRIYFKTKIICITIDGVIRIFGDRFQNIRKNISLWRNKSPQKYRNAPLGVAFFLINSRPRRGISFIFDGDVCANSMFLFENGIIY
jgi:hypothetical protein